MSATILTEEAAREASLNLLDDPKKGAQAVHDTVVAYQANRRSGTACTKTRGEVSGSGKKLWRQKGTGRARMGERRSPLWDGGGVVFGPKPRSYAKSVNKGTKRLAFRSALTARIGAGDVLATETFAVADGRTKSFMAALDDLGCGPRVLVIGASFDEPTYRAGRNVTPTLLMTAAEVNTEHLLKFEKIVVTRDALPALAQRTAG
jgi:large subunit ribosomal protein L4